MMQDRSPPEEHPIHRCAENTTYQVRANALAGLLCAWQPQPAGLKEARRVVYLQLQKHAMLQTHQLGSDPVESLPGLMLRE